MNNLKEYAEAQRKLYLSKMGRNFTEQDPMGLTVPGRWDEHEAYPYVEHIMEKFSKSELPQMGEHGACLDFGCGNGRMLRYFADLFYYVDGCDINPEFLVAARNYLDKHTPLLTSSRCKLYPTDGSSSKIGSAFADYDLVFSTITMIHIIPWSVRMNVLKDHYTLLKPGGRLCHQMIYSRLKEDMKFEHREWRYDEIEACTGGRNVAIFEKDLPLLTKDLESLRFKNIEFTFKDPPLPKTEGASKYTGCKWIYINATK